jgi:hypothetical protein
MEIKTGTSITETSSIPYPEACSQAFFSIAIPDFPGNSMVRNIAPIILSLKNWISAGVYPAF